ALTLCHSRGFAGLKLCRYLELWGYYVKDLKFLVSKFGGLSSQKFTSAAYVYSFGVLRFYQNKSYNSDINQTKTETSNFQNLTYVVPGFIGQGLTPA
ncbi:18413_t:CDS:2, partial [Racocetra persica]